MSGIAMQQPLTLGKRGMLLLATVMSVASALLAFGLLSAAKASNVAFCTNVLLQAGQGCHTTTFRKITRVNAYGQEEPVCAGALNGNGVEVGGWVCSPFEYGKSEASNGNYDGTKFYEGRVLNNITTWDYVSGLEYYNP